MSDKSGRNDHHVKVDPSSHPDVADLAQVLASIDPVRLGERVKRARKSRGLTQSHLAGEALSVSYLSRIESGSRRPEMSVLRAIARNLGTTAHQLLLGLSPREWSVRRVDLDWAQLALRTGDAEGALEKTTRIMADVPSGTRLARGATYVHALALEATGDYVSAAAHLEELVEADADDETPTLDMMTALCRCYRQSGEIQRAIDVGKRADGHLRTLKLDGTSAAVKLALTVAGSHAEAGDLGYASRLCERALAAAERLGTPFERAGCYWNSSIIASEQGHGEEAVHLAQRALHVLDEAESARNTARLRTQLGMLYLRLPEPRLEDALANLRHAAAEMENSDTNPVDLVTNALARSRAHLLAGDLVAADEGVRAAFADLGHTPAVIAAEAHLLQGRIRLAAQDPEGASGSYADAVVLLTPVGADRAAAQLWFELAGLWTQVGRTAEALHAFERAGLATGLRGASAPARVPVTEDA